MNMKAIGEKIVVKDIKPDNETVSQSGIIMRDSGGELHQKAEIVELSKDFDPGKYGFDKYCIVIFSKFAGREVNYKGEQLRILRIDDIIAVVDK